MNIEIKVTPTAVNGKELQGSDPRPIVQIRNSYSRDFKTPCVDIVWADGSILTFNGVELESAVKRATLINEF